MSVSIQHLSKYYGQQKAVDDISFEAVPGKVLGFLGPNGAGKSTTMKVATGYVLPTSGEVLVKGISVTQHPLKVKSIVGYLPEHNPMYIDMYIREFLKFIGKAYGLKSGFLKDRVEEIIGICGLDIESHKKIRQLSKGYRQRVGLAKALIADPNVLILDEPTSGLDPNQILDVRKVIKQISQEKTVILSTHIMQEVEAMCDHVVIINRGKLVANQSIQDLRRSTGVNRVQVRFEKPVQLEDFAGLKDVEIELQEEGYAILATSASEQLRSDLLKLITAKELPLTAIQDVGGSLEDIFHSLTQNQPAQA